MFMSNTDCLGTKVTTARRFFVDFERYDFETYKVPSAVLKLPTGAVSVGGGPSTGITDDQGGVQEQIWRDRGG